MIFLMAGIGAKKGFDYGVRVGISGTGYATNYQRHFKL